MKRVEDQYDKFLPVCSDFFAITHAFIYSFILCMCFILVRGMDSLGTLGARREHGPRMGCITHDN